MIAANPAIPKNKTKGTQPNKKTNCTLLSRQERFLNLRENIGISATNSHEVKPTKSKR